jgi:hypothetical protein
MILRLLQIGCGFEVNVFGSGEFGVWCLVLVGGKENHMRLVVYSNL